MARALLRSFQLHALQMQHNSIQNAGIFLRNAVKERWAAPFTQHAEGTAHRYMKHGA